jgi:hypothetical protein
MILEAPPGFEPGMEVLQARAGDQRSGLHSQIHKRKRLSTLSVAEEGWDRLDRLKIPEVTPVFVLVGPKLFLDRADRASRTACPSGKLFLVTAARVHGGFRWHN